MSQNSEYGGVEFTSTSDSEYLTLADSFVLGSRLEYLRRAAQHDYEIGDSESNRILGALAEVIQALRTSDVDSAVIAQISDFRTKVESKYEPVDSLDEDDATELERKSGTWWNMVLADIKRQQMIPTADPGLLNQQVLIEEPERIFSSGVWNWLDERPKADIEEAAKTLVVGCSTSSVILSLRAVEHCLREWYEYENESLEQAAWGQILDMLMQEFAEDEKKNDTVLTQLSDLPPVLTNLYYLKEKRNEVNHPDESPDLHEARQTLMIVASTITEIYEYITKREIEEIDALEPPREYEDDKDYIYSLTDMLESQYQSGVPRTAIYKSAEMFDKELTRDEIDDVIMDLLMGGQAYEPDDDRLKLI
ncbi:hypothetical protein [Natrialba hulunbeirensis]|nr:hypothetical protein [Natrialba hulunbeirensis]